MVERVSTLVVVVVVVMVVVVVVVVGKRDLAGVGLAATPIFRGG